MKKATLLQVACMSGIGFEPTTSTVSGWHSPAELAAHGELL